MGQRVGARLLAIALIAGAPGLGWALSLDDALALARDRNPELAEQRAERDRAAGIAQQTLQGVLPTISLDVGYVRADTSLLDEVPVPVVEPGRPPAFVRRDLGPIDGYVAGLQIVQPVVHVSAWHGRTQANRLVQAAELAVDRGEQELAVLVVEAYYGISAAELRLDAERRGLAAAERALAQAQGLYREGLVPPVDVYSARAQAAALRAREAEAEAAIVTARAQLHRLLGLGGGSDVGPSDPLPEPPRALPPQPVAVEQLAQRRDLLAQQQAVAAAEAGVRRARSDFLPRLDLLGRYQRFDGDDPFGDQDAWLVGVTLRWTPFAGMSQVGAVAEARAERQSANSRLQARWQEAWAEAETSHARWRGALASWDQARAGARDADLALRQTQGRYREGLATMTDLLRAQTDELAARTREVNARYAAVVAAYRHRLAAGLAE